MTPDHDAQPSWRKPAGVFLILVLITLWAILVTTAVDAMGELPTIALVFIYGIAGIIWIAPLRPILIWMETGRFR
jgi:hypothetical protein